jgi:hypothetical protein
MNYYQEERRLANDLCQLLSEEFEITTEADIIKKPGTFVLDGKAFKSIPDLLLHPNQSLIESGKFIDTVIPVEIKKFSKLETNKFEDLMFQCHSYRMSSFDGLHPKLCIYYVDNYFEYRPENAHLIYDNEASKDTKSEHHQIKTYIKDKIKVETLFGRFGIGELVSHGNDYTFRVKRQVLFQKKNGELLFNQDILNFWWGTKGARMNHIF